MAASNEFTEYIKGQLQDIGNISARRMFGGTLLELGGKQLGIIINGTLYFRVTNPSMQKQYKQSGSVQFSYTRKDKNKPIVIKNWWSVPEDAIDDTKELKRLAKEIFNQYL